MGPGGSSYVERTRLADRLPAVEFWDQPKTYGSAAYTDLVRSCRQKLEDLSRDGSPVDLIAHSFGGHLAVELMRSSPARVRSCLMVNTVTDLIGGFARLVNTAITDPSVPAELRGDLDKRLKAWRKRDDHDFPALIDVVLAIPDFMSYYWASPASYSEHQRIASQGPPLDLAQFMDVMAEFLRRDGGGALPPEGIPVRFLFGAEDPLSDFARECAMWRRFFPGSEFKLIPASGHHVHLEWNGFVPYLESGFLSAAGRRSP